VLVERPQHGAVPVDSDAGYTRVVDPQPPGHPPAMPHMPLNWRERVTACPVVPACSARDNVVTTSAPKPSVAWPPGLFAAGHRHSTHDPHAASVKTPVLQRVTASTVYRIMPACNPSSY
jgi:hypothetical protein